MAQLNCEIYAIKNIPLQKKRSFSIIGQNEERGPILKDHFKGQHDAARPCPAYQCSHDIGTHCY